MKLLNKQAEILITGSLQDATVNIYSLGNPVAVFSGITDVNGKVVKSLIDPSLPLLSYNDYTVEINKCDYDPIIEFFSIPDTTILNLTAGCSSAITTHETVYNHPDMDSHIIASAPHTGHETPTGAQTKVTTHETIYNHELIGSNAPGQGYYTGNGTANRAIPHGLGRHPVEVRILQWETGKRHYLINGNIALIYVMASAGFDYWGVSGVNATNFYVGNATSYAGSANENAIGYQWVAI